MMSTDTETPIVSRSVSVPMDVSSAVRGGGGFYPPVLLMYHPTMEQLAKNLTTRLHALSLTSEV